MPNYHAYAPVFDATGQARAGALLAAWALGRAGEGARPRAALDLACGSGGAALALAAAGADVLGVDRSPAMLEIARGRARGARLGAAFVELDVRRAFTRRAALGARPFDMVTCFGALNELVGDGDLRRVAAGAAAALRPGGTFAFGLRRADELLEARESDELLHDGPDHLAYARLALDDESPVGERRVVWFVREIDRWWRGEETHPLRIWSDAEARAALAAAGLELAEAAEVEGTGQVAYVARKTGR